MCASCYNMKPQGRRQELALLHMIEELQVPTRPSKVFHLKSVVLASVQP